jgi:hypothetical protein
MSSEYDRDAAAVIAGGIERMLELHRSGNLGDISFVADISETDPAFWAPPGRKVPDLRAAWNLADSYSDAAWHGFPDADGLPMADAAELLAEMAWRLRAGTRLPGWAVARFA